MRHLCTENFTCRYSRDSEMNITGHPDNIFSRIVYWRRQNFIDVGWQTVEACIRHIVKRHPRKEVCPGSWIVWLIMNEPGFETVTQNRAKSRGDILPPLECGHNQPLYGCQSEWLKQLFRQPCGLHSADPSRPVIKRYRRKPNRQTHSLEIAIIILVPAKVELAPLSPNSRS